MRDIDLEDDLALAHELADAADAITTSRFRARDLRVQTKPDQTPVTEVDRGVEQMVRKELEAARPGDAVVGEEFGVLGDSRRRWIVDPIDGTMSFVRGVPAWGTLLALEVDGEVVVGVVSSPALGRRWWAQRGSGAFANGEAIRVSGVERLEDAHLCAPHGRYFDEAGLGAGFRDLARRAWRPAGFADFWGHVLVAEGSADVMVEPVLSLWDIAALLPIVEEAGGRISGFDGAAWTGGGCVTTNGRLHEVVLAAFGESR